MAAAEEMEISLVRLQSMLTKPSAVTASAQGDVCHLLQSQLPFKVCIAGTTVVSDSG